jgi:Flp pilus assembly protein TadD
VLVASLSALCLLLSVEASAQPRRPTPAPPKTGRQQQQAQAPRTDSSPLVREAAAQLQAGQLAEAETTARKAIVSTPRDPSAHALLGVILDQRVR